MKTTESSFPPKLVLCTTDLTPERAQAVDAAVELAALSGARLLLVHVVEGLDPRYESLLPKLEKDLVARAEEALRKHPALKEKRLKFPPEVRVGRAVGRRGVVEELLRLTAKRRPDCVVVGARGADADGNSTPPLGRVAQRLVQRSPAPVLVARPGRVPPLRRILCAVAFSPCSKTGLHCARHLAEAAGLKKLAVLNSFELPVGYQYAGLTEEAVEKKLRTYHEGELEKMLRDFRDLSSVKPEPRVVLGAPAEAIVAAAEKEDADLIVVGTHGRSSLVAFFTGGVTERVLHTTTRSVLAVKSPEHQLSLLSALEDL